MILRSGSVIPLLKLPYPTGRDHCIIYHVTGFEMSPALHFTSENMTLLI